MARFIECRTSQGVVYQVNVDQITYLQRGAKDEIGARNFLSAALSIRTTRCFAVNRRVVPRGDHSLEVKAARFGSNRHAARRRFMLRSTVRCSRTRPYRSARRRADATTAFGKNVEQTRS
jgi:hypothetical protein